MNGFAQRAAKSRLPHVAGYVISAEIKRNRKKPLLGGCNGLSHWEWRGPQEDTGLTPEEIRTKLKECEALRPDVLTFAKAMETVLRKHDDRPGWENEPLTYLYSRLNEEWFELQAAEVSSEDEFMRELIDVANFCMMIYCNLMRAKSKKGTHDDSQRN